MNPLIIADPIESVCGQTTIIPFLNKQLPFRRDF